ncbi:DUF2254 domain-containing protein [Stakelama pacifica]|uniref:Putative membrane protein n=1 Tax=Stakelama pacifica TaxID=517720 RepID=A0A4R6FJD1_9SPHN|nr:DUF2254 domain-containing protein [Stakelama pacifica]TDN80635.1 putative membrane protein [Stakelama pacifica]GGO97583.1 hypothetical protein GCM10011329_26800 [Stakelama pacifica]
MKAWFRQLVVRLNASYWFLPAVLTIGAILLSFLTYYIDVRLGPDWLDAAGWLHASKPDGARSLLSTIAGSMISVAGTVFAITIAAVVYASGSYGPRLLTNFMTDRGNQLSLGVFIANFTYCLMVLRTVRQPDEGGFLIDSGQPGFVPELSLLVALALTMLSVGVLVYFLHHVPDSIRINNVVAAIGRRALSEIDSRFPDSDDGTMRIAPSSGEVTPVRAKRTGYVEVIDFDTLGSVCEDQGISVRLTVRPGDFVHPDVAICKVEGTFGEGVDDRLRRAFAIGDSRTSAQDIEYLLDELVEIGLRALSPGINDPFTAITCLHWLSAATALLAKRDLACDSDGRPYGEQGVYALADDFDHFVSRGFGSIRASAAESPLAARIFVESIHNASAGHPAGGRIESLRREARLLLEQAEGALHGPALEDVRRAVAKFTDA